MRYKPVERVVTVEFVQAPSGSGYDIDVTPEALVVRFGDTVVWDVQGLTPSRALKIAIGNFDQLVTYPSVSFGKKGFAPAKPKRIPTADVPVKGVANGKFRAKLNLGPATLGIYKYDIKSDGRSLLDPEMEIKGPKGR